MLIHTPLIDIPAIQEHIIKNRKKINELGLLYDKRNKLNPLRWGVKPKYTSISTYFTNIHEQIKGTI